MLAVTYEGLVLEHDLLSRTLMVSWTLARTSIVAWLLVGVTSVGPLMGRQAVRLKHVITEYATLLAAYSQIFCRVIVARDNNV